MRKITCLAVMLVLATSSFAFAQNAASNKAFFASHPQGCATVDPNQQGCIVLASFNGGPTTSEVTLFTIDQALKTSNGGAASAILSMESVLWTFNTVTATNKEGRTSSSARATIKAWVEIDGVPMKPAVLVSPGPKPPRVVEGVVYADRLQATGLDVNLACTITVVGTTGTCAVTGDVTLDLFQATKNANSFVFFLGPLGPTIHSVKAVAVGSIECLDNSGATMTCPQTTLTTFQTAGTLAAIGKASLLIEEQQNWGSQ